MSQNLITLMTTAAELRTGGMSWEFVAREVNRKAGTCSKWPSRYKREWNRIYMDAQRQRYEEVSNESLTYLRSLLRSKNDKTKLKSIELSLRYGPAAIAAINEANGAKNPEDDAKYEKWLRYQAGEDDWRRRIDRERALKGLPPATDAEFYEEWTAKLEEIQNPRILNLHFDANGYPIERPAGEPEYIGKAEFDARMAKGWVKHENGNHTPAEWERTTPPSAPPRSQDHWGMFATSILLLVSALAIGLGFGDARPRGAIVESRTSPLATVAYASGSDLSGIQSAPEWTLSDRTIHSHSADSATLNGTNNMKQITGLASLLILCAPTFAADPPKPFIEGLKNPESVCVGLGGKVYVTEIGEFDKDGDGRVLLIQGDKAVPFTEGLDDPKGIAPYQKWLFVADKTKVLRIDEKGKATVFASAEAFPTKPKFLNDIHVDPESGTIYVSDSGDLKGKGGAVYRIDPKGKVTLLLDEKNFPGINTPNGLHLDGQAHLLMADAGTGELFRIKLADKSRTKLADGFGATDGVCWDHFGRLYVSDWKNGKVWVIPRPGAKQILLAEGFKSAADICLDPSGKNILVPDMMAGTITALPIKVPGWEVDDRPLPLETAVAFPDLKWTGWKGETDSGKIVPLRPLVLTHAGDGSNRVFVATEQGVIHVFPNDQKAKETKIFLDIQDRVSYKDNENEEGFLGLTFHPKYKENGEFFVFYTIKKDKLTNVVSRFKVSKDDPNKADPASEEVLLTFKKPYWNHDGGTLCFGPDGYLYITHGDGGAFNDPHENGQNLNTHLGKILRIDVDKKDDGKNYAIPMDNPFIKTPDAKPEIWAYGLRNVWRMSFDRKTGQLWAADVGQNLYEEINLIGKGGNYGWNRREALHPFGVKGVGQNDKMIDPIWEYHHDIGKSITGGHVYRGTRLPELEGMYLYADYVSAKIWALKYDEAKKRVTVNRPIQDRAAPIMSFGEDEKGEVYLMTYTATGKGIYWFVKAEK